MKRNLLAIALAIVATVLAWTSRVEADDIGAQTAVEVHPACDSIRVIATGFGPNFRNSATVDYDTALPVVRLFGASMDQTFPSPSTSGHTVTVTVRTPARIVYGPQTFTIGPCQAPTTVPATTTPPTSPTTTTDICVCPPTTEEPSSTTSPPTTPPTSDTSTSTTAPDTNSTTTSAAPPSSTSSPSSSTTTSPSLPTPSSDSPPSFVTVPECQPVQPPATLPPQCHTLPATGSTGGTIAWAAIGALGLGLACIVVAVASGKRPTP